LWLKASNGKFGFSVQKDIWIEVGGTLKEFDLAQHKKFCDRIGWRKGGGTLEWWTGGNWVEYNQLTFNINAPRGHLPSNSWIEKLKSNRWSNRNILEKIFYSIIYLVFGIVILAIPIGFLWFLLTLLFGYEVSPEAKERKEKIVKWYAPLWKRLIRCNI
jgi:hypothetical protein